MTLPCLDNLSLIGLKQLKEEAERRIAEGERKFDFGENFCYEGADGRQHGTFVEVSSLFRNETTRGKVFWVNPAKPAFVYGDTAEQMMFRIHGIHSIEQLSKVVAK